jgi:hypothetical protein
MPWSICLAIHVNPGATMTSETRKHCVLLLAFYLPWGASAHDFPTSGRVEYVLECMQQHDSKYAYLYKCACVIDQIAKELSYDTYLTMATALRNQGLAGERGAVFRDPAPVKALAKQYQDVQTRANKTCDVQP